MIIVVSLFTKKSIYQQNTEEHKMPEAHRLSIRRFPRWKDDQTTRARGQQGDKHNNKVPSQKPATKAISGDLGFLLLYCTQ